jgi:hypothetical protein
MATDLPPTGPGPEATTKLQILATEHWSLLATRSLTYTELLARVNIFLAILSGAVIALALVAQANRFGRTFVLVAIPVLLVVLFVGVVTIRRLSMLNREDYRWVLGMNRLRHAYLEVHPELEPYFITGVHDDLPGALRTLGIDNMRNIRVGSFVHLANTLPGMLTVIVAAVAATVVALVGVGIGLPSLVTILITGAGFLVALVLITLVERRSVRGVPVTLEPRFPSPSSPDA